MRIPKTIYHLKSNLLFVAGLAMFCLFFTIIYTPNYGLSEEAVSLNDMGSGHHAIMLWYRHQGLCLPICCAIILAVTALSRALMLTATRTARLRESDYLWWQVAEVTATALFLDLFLSLLLHLNFLENLPLVLLVYISVAVYPYAIYWLLAERIDRDMRLAEARRTIVQLRQPEADNGNSMLRFADNGGTVRLVVGADSIVTIEGSGNYVTILYRSGDRLTRFALRNTLKGIEPLCDGTQLVRCHRSFYINLNRVSLLRKTPDGLMAQMEPADVPDVPVSKSYAAEVVERFGNKK